MANNELKWSADEIADACVKAGLGILECHSLMVTLKATPPVAAPAQGGLSDAPGELTQAYAWEFARQIRMYLLPFAGQNFTNTESVDRMNLGQALDHLEEAAAIILNLSSRGQQGGVSDAARLDFVPVKLDPVVEANRALLYERSQVGIRKYGTTLGDANLTERELTMHALEEALDLSNYLQAQLQRMSASEELQAAWQVPLGWQLVPINLTEVMREACVLLSHQDDVEKCWHDFLHSSPLISSSSSECTLGEWIAIEDQYPKRGESVLVLVAGQVGIGGYSDREAGPVHGWWFTGVNCEDDDALTHWQPLPAPPAIQAQAGDAPMGGV